MGKRVITEIARPLMPGLYILPARLAAAVLRPKGRPHPFLARSVRIIELADVFWRLQHLSNQPSCFSIFAPVRELLISTGKLENAGAICNSPPEMESDQNLSSIGSKPIPHEESTFVGLSFWSTGVIE
jgi:hypothetical protein